MGSPKGDVVGDAGRVTLRAGAVLHGAVATIATR